jgi:hypothetical protein
VAVKLANIKFGQFVGNQHVGSANLPTPPISQAKAAEMLNVGVRSVATAAKVSREAPAPVVEALADGRGDGSLRAPARSKNGSKNEDGGRRRRLVFSST